MIKNERQYRITAAQADRFERSLEDYSNTPPPGSEIHPRLWEAQREAITNQLAELRTELAEYEALRTGERRVFDVRELKDVSRALIEGRIAVGMTQKDLGSRLKLPEQAIQRYEATDYTSASLERIAEVAAAIGIELSGLMTLRSATPTRKQFFDRLAEIGLDRRFLLERVLPPTIAAALEIPSRAKDTVSGALLQAAGTIERVFKIKPTALFGNAVLTLDPAIAGATRFKRSKRAGKPIPPEVDGYTVFAHYLAMIALQATTHLARKRVPSTASEWRSAILDRFGSLSFESVARFFWSLGIPVLPLRDRGHFYGACWRTAGRDVVVLKQKSLSEDRWTHDSLHEGSHIIDHGSDEAFSVIENEVPSPEEPAEERAARFAADVVLDGRADELAELAVDRANNEVSFLKRSVPQVAHDTAVSVGALANYLAFRISKETADTPRPINWWGTAAKLQRQTKDPWDIARNVFLEHADLSRLNPSDRDLLVRALVDLE